MILFFYFGISLLFDLFGLTTRPFGCSSSGVISWLIPGRTAFLISIGLSLSIQIFCSARGNGD